MPEIARLIGPPEADGEYVALRDDSDEEVIHLHDYERLYRVPGLYEYVVQDLLQCRSPQVAADGLAYALTRLGIDPAETVFLRRTRFQHRVSTTRSPIHYELVVAATGSDEVPLGVGTS